jgi:membrane-associated protein
LASRQGLHPLDDLPRLSQEDLDQRFASLPLDLILLLRLHLLDPLVIGSVATWIEHFRGPIVYLVCGALVFGEASLMIGFVIPGETAAVIGGALVALHSADLWIMIVVIVGCAIAGDSTGYEIGRRFGPWLLERRALHDHRGVVKSRELIARYGGAAVFVGRWTAVARAVVPGIAGVSGMSYPTFLVFNATGGILWGTSFVLLGYVVGRQFETVLTDASYVSYSIIGLVVLAAVAYIVVRRRRRRKRRRMEEEQSAPPEQQRFGTGNGARSDDVTKTRDPSGI